MKIVSKPMNENINMKINVIKRTLNKGFKCVKMKLFYNRICRIYRIIDKNFLMTSIPAAGGDSMFYFLKK